MGNSPPPEPTGPEAQALLKKAQEAGHLPEGFVEKELAAVRGEIHGETHARVGAVAHAELTPEDLALCLRGLEADYNRGIVVVDDTKEVDAYKVALAEDKTANTSWDAIKERLLENDSALLRRAARMQGRGELIGVDERGKLVVISRADKQGNREPERFGFRADQIEEIGHQRKPKTGEKPILINTDTPSRDRLMAEIKESGLFADYWEIRGAVTEGGYALPPDSPDFKKEGIVAAVEVVTRKDFIRSADGKEWRSAVLECGDVSRSAHVRVVNFAPAAGDARVRGGDPESRADVRGAVRVLRG